MGIEIEDNNEKYTVYLFNSLCSSQRPPASMGVKLKQASTINQRSL